MILFDGATHEPTLIARVYRGYEISPLGSVVGLLWALPDGLIGGAVFAWLYNRLAGGRPAQRVAGVERAGRGRRLVIDELVEAWRVNNRVNLRLLEAIDDDGLLVTLSTRGGRNVVRQFAHLHTNRVWQLEKRARALAEGLVRFQTHDEPERATLVEALCDSADRVEQMFVLAAQGTAGVRVFKRGLVPYLAYFVAHESHHRGNILLTLKQSGQAVDANVRMGLWDWDRL